jgi:hypothetical protein
MLERTVGFVVLVPGDVHLPVPRHLGAVPVDEDLRVEPVSVRRELGIPEGEPDTQTAPPRTTVR